MTTTLHKDNKQPDWHERKPADKGVERKTVAKNSKARKQLDEIADKVPDKVRERLGLEDDESVELKEQTMTIDSKGNRRGTVFAIVRGKRRRYSIREREDGTVREEVR